MSHYTKLFYMEPNGLDAKGVLCCKFIIGLPPWVALQGCIFGMPSGPIGYSISQGTVR